MRMQVVPQEFQRASCPDRVFKTPSGRGLFFIAKKGKETMNERMQKALEYLEQNEKQMIDTWKNIVSIESRSSERANVDKIMAHLDTYCDAMQMQRRIIRYENAGSSFVAETEPGPQRPVALLGHVDTVHPTGAFGKEPFQINGDLVTGPGVMDCKGGVVAALYAIRALRHVGYADRQIKLILSGDEEVAHSFSNGEGGLLFERECRGCAAALNCEPGTMDGSVTVQRKGGAIFEIEVFGKAAHAGKEPEKGANAIRQAAEMICRIENASVLGETTYNCGVIQGGKGANVIPDYCRFDVGLRYKTNAQYQEAQQMLQALCDKPAVAGTHCNMKQNGFYPAMEKTPKTEQLFSLYQSVCGQLGGLVPEGISQGGCSDSAFATRAGVPALCSLGVHGEGAHSLQECAKVSSLLLQAKRLTAMILELPQDF